MEDDVLVVPIFFRGASGPTHLPIRHGASGLAHDSVLLCEEVTTIDLEFLHEGPLGEKVPDALPRQVVRGIRIAAGDVPLPGT